MLTKPQQTGLIILMHLADPNFEEINGGYVAFGGNPKGGKITGKGKIKTGKLDFDDVYFVKELKFNLFIVSQIRNKKNSVLCTNTECVVLSSDYKLPNENHVLLRVPRENNMYNVDLKNVVLSGDLTFLFAKAILDESNIWHRRLGHINFKTMNKLVKGNLVRGLPSKIFENNHTCVACKKGKQHRASCNSKHVTSVSQPLQRLHMDLFGATFVKGLNKKSYCLVVTDDYRIGPNWLFDIDTLTQSMNYQPVVAGNQPNHNAGFKENLDACKVRKETVYAQQYVLLPLWSTGSQDPQNTDADVIDAAFNVKENEKGVHVSLSGSDKPKKYNDKAKRDDREKSPVDLSTRVRDLRAKFEEFFINSTNRVNAVNPSKYPDDLDMPELEDIVYSNDEEDNNPREYTKHLKIQVGLKPCKKSFYSLKCKRFRNKARLVAQGHTQEERIDYDEVIALVARIEAIWLFLAYASFMGFMIYQMDVKSAFLYGTIKEKVYPNKVYVDDIIFGSTNKELCKAFEKLMKEKFQMSSMGELTFFLGLQVKQKDDGIFISQDKYVAKILRKFGFTDVKSASIPIETKKPLLKDPDDEDVDVHIYKSMIVKRIFRYLKGKPHLGLWYPKDSPFNLVAYSDSDYAGDSLDRKSTTRGCQFLVCRLISWQCKKHTVVTTSSTEAKYVAAASCCAQVVVTEDVIRSNVHLDDADGVECLPNEEIFTELTQTCATLSQKVVELEQDKHTQALEILKRKKRVKRRMHPNRGKIAEIDANVDITLVDMETQVDMDAELQGRIDDDNVATKDVNAAEPTVFNDEEVTTTMAQTLIKMKAKKAKLLDEQIAKRLHDEEVKQAAAREKQEKDDLERAQVLQQQYDNKEENIDWNVVAEQIQEKHLDNIRKYQNLKRKPVSIALAKKNMIIYLKNMAGYKMEYFRGMNYDKVRPIFKREYKKVQTLFKLDKDVEEPQKKRVAEETLLHESFKKLKAVKVSGSDSTQETLTNDPKEINWEIHTEGSRTYWKIIRVGGITEAYHSFEDMLKGFDREDLVALWSLVKEKFSTAVPNVNKEKALWVELKRLFEPDADDVLWKL
nr:hypothetical protein [Tanacetum cinerariifolium]